jgi:septal ring factor EnvC (AmiA/AmiB activator)
MIQRYETELAAAKNKIAEMQQARDDFADQNAVLQQELADKEQQIENLQNQPPFGVASFITGYMAKPNMFSEIS